MERKAEIDRRIAEVEEGKAVLLERELIDAANEYHTQQVTIVLNKRSDLYRKVESLAKKQGVPIEAIVDALVTLGAQDGMVKKLPMLEK